MQLYKTGDRVQVSNLILEEPCAEVEELRNKVGTVLDPAVDDQDYDGNPVTKVLVKLDDTVNLDKAFAGDSDGEFVFLTEELSLYVAS